MRSILLVTLALVLFPACDSAEDGPSAPGPSPEAIKTVEVIKANSLSFTRQFASQLAEVSGPDARHSASGEVSVHRRNDSTFAARPVPNAYSYESQSHDLLTYIVTAFDGTTPVESRVVEVFVLKTASNPLKDDMSSAIWTEDPIGLSKWYNTDEYHQHVVDSRGKTATIQERNSPPTVGTSTNSTCYYLVTRDGNRIVSAIFLYCEFDDGGGGGGGNGGTPPPSNDAQFSWSSSNKFNAKVEASDTMWIYWDVYGTTSTSATVDNIFDGFTAEAQVDTIWLMDGQMRWDSGVRSDRGTGSASVSVTNQETIAVNRQGSHDPVIHQSSRHAARANGLLGDGNWERVVKGREEILSR